MSMSTNIMDIEKGSKIDCYTVIRKLGEGGMGSVYLCSYEFDSNVRVAIKILDDKADKRRFRREIKVMQKATEKLSDRRSHIVRYLDHDEWNGKMYLAMEYVNGGSIEDYLREKKKFDEKTAAWISIQALRGLRQANVIHRDLKPANVLVSGGMVQVQDGNREEWLGGIVKIADFGLAKEEEDGNGNALLTMSGAILGTGIYMSPEQCRSIKSCDVRSDIYSLGCMLYEMCTGCYVFNHESLYDMMNAHMKEEVLFPRKMSIEMRKILERMLEKDVRRRYQSLIECERALCCFCEIAIDGVEKISTWSKFKRAFGFGK
jgi:serine/threonine protein kinase